MCRRQARAGPTPSPFAWSGQGRGLTRCARIGMHGVTTACYFQQDIGVQILAHCALTFMRARLGADLGPPDQSMAGYQAIPDNVTTQNRPATGLLDDVPCPDGRLRERIGAWHCQRALARGPGGDWLSLPKPPILTLRHASSCGYRAAREIFSSIVWYMELLA